METAIAREFRPKLFVDVIGQEVVTRALSNAITKNRLYHAYLFCGNRGTGKTSVSRILAKCVNCTTGPTIDPCGTCAPCLDNSNNISLDVSEIDAASSSGVDNVRDNIISRVNYSPLSSKYKIFVLDECHNLSATAFNALLKTIEEPPPHVIFILCTTEKHKIPETIISRCQVFEFKPITLSLMVDSLKFVCKTKKIKISDTGLNLVARSGLGSMRDAQTNLDKVLAYAGCDTISDGDITKALNVIETKVLAGLLSFISKKDIAKSLNVVEELHTRGYNLKNFALEVMLYIRALIYTKVVGFDSEVVELSSEEKPRLEALSALFDESALIKLFYAFSEAEQLSRTSANQRMHIEAAVVKYMI